MTSLTRDILIKTIVAEEMKLCDSSDYKKTLFQSVIDQSHVHGRKHIIAEDALRKPMNYGSYTP